MPVHVRIVTPRKIAFGKHVATDRVVDVVTHVRDAVSDAHDLPFESLGEVLARVPEDAVADFPGQIESLSLELEHFDHSK